MKQLTGIDARILELVVSGRCSSRASVARHLSIARSTASQHVEYLLRHGLLTETAESGSRERGRPAVELSPGPALGLGLVVVLRPQGGVVALVDARGDALEQVTVPASMRADPQESLAVLLAGIGSLLEGHSVDGAQVRQIVIGLPAPVDPTEGSPSHRSVYPQWAHWLIGERLSERLGAPTLVENDANLMALGAAVQHGPPSGPLLYLELSHGVGAGLVLDGETIYRGATGSAGDIGHLRLSLDGDVQCACGKEGCIATLISVPAFLKRAGEAEPEDPDGWEAIRMRVAQRDPILVRTLRDVADDAGKLAAILVDSFNPATLVVGGELTDLGDDFIAGVRARVYVESTPPSTSTLTIVSGGDSNKAALRGGGFLVHRALVAR